MLMMHCALKMMTLSLPTAPTGAPHSVAITSTTFNTITLAWEEVECSERNGEITGYLVHCTDNNAHNESVTIQWDTMMFTFQNLEPDTTYVFWVAAVNSNETGPPSNLVEGRTEKEMTSTLIIIVVATTFGGIVAILAVVVTCTAALHFR